MFNPFPPPITTTFGPSSYIVLLKIKPFIFKLAFFPFSVVVLFASINISKTLLCIYIKPTTIAVNPKTNSTTICIISFGLNTFDSNIFAKAKHVKHTPTSIKSIHLFIFVLELNQLKKPFIYFSSFLMRNFIIQLLLVLTLLQISLLLFL